MKYKVTIRRPVVETYSIEVDAPTQRDAEDFVRADLENNGDRFFLDSNVKHERTNRDVGFIRVSHIRASKA